jgi:putative ABC transport system ATP-binding protein
MPPGYGRAARPRVGRKYESGLGRSGLPADTATGPARPQWCAMDTLVQLSNVTKRYDSGPAPAVADVSLAIAAGEAVAIMGPSGSGKSTLLNLIAGMDRPTSGAVRVGGERVDALSETAAARFRRRQVGMIFQFFNLLDDMTVIDNVLLPAQLAGTGAAAARERAERLLAALRIEHRRDAYPARLSGGERQRAAIARALVNEPVVLLADEPTGAVDTAAGEEIGALLLQLNAAGQTLILVTHNADLAARYTRRVVAIADGRIASDSRPPGRTMPPPAASRGAGR